MADTPAQQEVSRDEKGRWPQGQSGNPKGRTPGSLSLTALLRQQLRRLANASAPAMNVAETYGLPVTDETTVAEVCIAAMCFQALAGNTKMLEMVIDRVDGKQVIPSRHEVNGRLSTGDFITGYVNGDGHPEESGDAE